MKKEKGIKVCYQKYRTVPKWILDLGRRSYQYQTPPSKVVHIENKYHETPHKMKSPIIRPQRTGEGGAAEKYE